MTTTATTTSQSARSTSQPGSKVLARREAIWGYLFISPFIIGLFSFVLLPTLATFIMSFTNFKLSGTETQFIGLQNYQNLARDSQIWSSLWITVKFALISLPVGLLVPLLLAVLLNSAYLYGKGIFRTLFYFPYIVPFVAAIFVWSV